MSSSSNHESTAGLPLGSERCGLFSMDSPKEASESDSTSGNMNDNDGGFEKPSSSSIDGGDSSAENNEDGGEVSLRTKAAVMVQKQFRSYRARRRLAAEQNWFKAISHALPILDPETAASIGNRLRLKAYKELEKTSELDSILLDNTPMKLQSSPAHIPTIVDDGKEGCSIRKVWFFLVANVVVELLSAAFDQLASVHRPEYALAAILMALIGLVGAVTELAYKGRQENAGWRWHGEIPWFYRPAAAASTSYRRFGSFAEIFGVVCAILQSITAIVAYVFYTRHSDNPIKLSFWPIVFAIGLLCSQVLKDLCLKVSEIDHAGHIA